MKMVSSFRNSVAEQKLEKRGYSHEIVPQHTLPWKERCR
jgi:hypothetical protein